MKKNVCFIIIVIIVSACTFVLGLKYNTDIITKQEAVNIAEMMIEREVDYSFISDSQIEVKDVYEIKRWIPGFNDGSISVYVDKRTGKVVNIIN